MTQFEPVQGCLRQIQALVWLAREMHRCRIGINPEDVAIAIKKFSNRQKRKKSTGAVPSRSELSERFDQVQFLRKMVRAAESGGEPAAGKLAFQASRRVFGGH